MVARSDHDPRLHPHPHLRRRRPAGRHDAQPRLEPAGAPGLSTEGSSLSRRTQGRSGSRTLTTPLTLPRFEHLVRRRTTHGGNLVMTAPRRLAALVRSSPSSRPGGSCCPSALPTPTTRVVRDAAHDVVAGTPDEEVPDGVDPSRRARRTSSGLRVTHRARSVRAVVSYAALTPASARGRGGRPRARGADGRGRARGDVPRRPRDGSRPGGQLLWDGERRAPERLPRGGRAHRPEGRDRHVTIPRRCLSQPPLGARGRRGRRDQPGQAVSRRRPLVRGSVGHDLVLGPRVRR